MPKKTRKTTSEEIVQLREIVQLKVENTGFETLFRSTLAHYEGLQLVLSELATSIEIAKQDITRLIKLLDEKKAAVKLMSEKGVQKGGTG